MVLQGWIFSDSLDEMMGYVLDHVRSVAIVALWSTKGPSKEEPGDETKGEAPRSTKSGGNRPRSL